MRIFTKYICKNAPLLGLTSPDPPNSLLILYLLVIGQALALSWKPLMPRLKPGKAHSHGCSSDEGRRSLASRGGSFEYNEDIYENRHSGVSR